MAQALNPGTSFDATSADQGQSDNSPIEHTYQVVAWENNGWLSELTMHNHVFVRPVHTAGLLDPNTHIVGDILRYYAFTPEQLNVVLFKMSLDLWKKKKEYYYPQQAAGLFKYVGICQTPPDQPKGSTKHVLRKNIVCHYRSSVMMDNYWPDCKGTDHLMFMFKLVDCTNLGRYGTSVNGAAVNLESEGMTRCVQLVSLRSPTRIPSTLACARFPGDVTKSKMTGMGVHIPVGMCTRNPYMLTYERDDEKHAVEGVVCNDLYAASTNHIHALTLAI